jgi:hypothetical protein
MIVSWLHKTFFLARDLGKDDFSWVVMMVAGHQINTTTHGLGETGAGPPREAMAGHQKEIVAGPLRDMAAGPLTDGPQAEIVIGLLTDGLLIGAAPAQSENSHQVAPRYETRVSSGWGSTQGNGRRGRAAPA